MTKRIAGARDARALLATALALTIALPTCGAFAQDIVKDAKASLSDLPGWKIPDICAKDSAQAHCLALESRAWRAVSGSWVSVPDAVKTLCLSNAKTPADQSWRVLGDCIDEEMEKRGDKKAVATGRTPGEAVPPPKAVAPPPVAVAKVDVPPSPIPFPVAPPPFAVDAEADAKRKAEADAAAKKAADEAAAKRLADEAASKKAADEADVKRRAEAEAKRLADEAAAKKAADEAEAKRRAEAEAKRLADEAAARKAADDAEKKRIADAEAAAAAEKRAQAAAAAKACEDKIKTVSAAGAIRFRVGSATLDRASNATLDLLAEAIKSCPGNAIRVEGHTDSQGEPSFNLDLSRNRAQAVTDYLVRAGVAADLISAEGFGDTRPVGENGTSEGRAQNRRIDFKVQAR